MSTTTALLISWSVISAAMILLMVIERISINRALRSALNTNEQNKSLHAEYEATHEQAATMAQQFIDAPKLIQIHRSGRENIFTFARGHDYFTIETMGLLNDDVDGWRKQAGITAE